MLSGPPNKGMKLTRPAHIGAFQLIPSVRPQIRTFGLVIRTYGLPGD